MNALGKVLILVFLLHQVQQGEQAIRPSMGLIIVLSNTSREKGESFLNIIFSSIGLDPRQHEGNREPSSLLEVLLSRKGRGRHISFGLCVTLGNN